MRAKRNKKGPMSEINVVPYIDVMLVLLIIFMVTTPLLSQGVKVELPKASAQALAKKKQEPIIVSVDQEGNYYLNVAQNPNQPIAATDLVTQVAAEMQASQQQDNQARQVLVKGDQRVDYGKVVAAMVLLQQAGAQSVGLMTTPPEKNPS